LHTNVLCSAFFGSHPKNTVEEEDNDETGFIENVVVEKEAR
jgi:hypothetical protein